MKRLCAEEVALIKKTATERLKEISIKAGQSASEINTWDRECLIAVVGEDSAKGLVMAPEGAGSMLAREERRLREQKRVLVLREQERNDRLKEKKSERADRKRDREMKQQKNALEMARLRRPQATEKPLRMP